MRIYLMSLIWTFGTISIAAQAQDLNLGNKAPDGTEVVRISARISGAVTKVRFAPYFEEVKCSKFRKDLCGHETDVKVVELTVPSKNCKIVSPTLLACDGFEYATAMAILNDGTILPLDSIAGTLRVIQETDLEPDAQDVFQTVTTVGLQFEIWGDRADGLDPLIVSGQRTLFQPGDDLQVVSKSLFD